MYQALFLLLALALLLTVFRLLWIVFPRLKTKSGKILSGVCLLLLFLPLLVPILLNVHPAYVFAVILAAGITGAALIDGREGTTAYELYPVALGLSAPIVIVADFIQGEPHILYQGVSSPVIGLLAGLGLAALAGMIELAVSPAESLVLGTIEMAAVTGFFAGFPGVLWVIGLSVPLCFAARFYAKRHPERENQLCCNGCIAYALLLYLCFHPLLGI